MEEFDVKAGNFDLKGLTPLHIAALNGDEQLVAGLIDGG